MIPTYHSLYPSSSSLMEKNEDQCYQRLTPHEASFSSLSRTIILNTDQDHGRSYYKEQEQLQRQEKKSTIWKKEDQAGNQTEHGSAKWIPSKIRMMRKMMNSEQTPSSPMQKFQDHKQPNSSLFDTDHNSRNNISYSSNNSSNMVRVCADCSTTKTPLWRSGPKGPKSLCNACGIRQRKARRAAMAAAEANGTVLGADKKPMKYKVQRKEKRSSTESFIKPFKKRFKVKAPSREEKKIAFEDFTLSLSNKHSAFQQVFPQDEREAAILLMALSHGLVHG